MLREGKRRNTEVGELVGLMTLDFIIAGLYESFFSEVNVLTYIGMLNVCTSCFLYCSMAVYWILN